jgi:hypothetical protein
MPEILSSIKKFLKERETLIPRPKAVDLLGESFLGQEVPIIDKVKPEDAIEVIAGSTWAKSLAEGVCGGKYAGLTPGTPEYERCVYNVSHRVAARVLGLTWSPPPTPPPPRRRR